MKKFWKFSSHFAERVVDRVDVDPVEFSKSVAKVFNDRCLEFVYECFYRGNKGRRVIHGNYVICFEWDETQNMIVVKTVFKKQKKKKSECYGN